MTKSTAARARLALCGAIAWSHAVAPRALADDPLPLTLRWQAPSECPSQTWVQSRVQRYLDAGVELASSAELQVEVEVRDEAGIMQAQATIRSPHGEHTRRFGDARCVVVADAAAFVIAQAIDPLVRADQAPLTEADIAEAERSSPRGQSETTASAQPPAEDPDSARAGDEVTKSEADEDEDDDADEAPEAPSAPLRIAWAASLQGELAYGPLPELGPAAALRVSVLLGRALRIELGASYQWPQARALSSDPSVAARFDQAGGLLAMCGVFAGRDSELGVCLRALLALQRGRGAALSAGQDDAAPYLALSLAPLLLQRIAGGLWGRFELGPLLPLVWPRFMVDEQGSPTVVHEPEGIGVFAALGAEWRFD